MNKSQDSQVWPSCSEQKRVAVMKGEPMPTFSQGRSNVPDKAFDPETVDRWTEYAIDEPRQVVLADDYDSLLALYRAAQDKINALEVENVEVD